MRSGWAKLKQIQHFVIDLFHFKIISGKKKKKSCTHNVANFVGVVGIDTMGQASSH